MVYIYINIYIYIYRERERERESPWSFRLQSAKLSVTILQLHSSARKQLSAVKFDD